MRRLVLSLALLILAALLATRCAPADASTHGRYMAGQMARITIVH